jgi:hypothetical protein
MATKSAIQGRFELSQLRGSPYYTVSTVYKRPANFDITSIAIAAPVPFEP